MKILLADNLVSIFRSRVNLRKATNNPEWEKVLEQIQGTWVEIETDHLFSWQFNSRRLPGVSEIGIRVEAWMIASERKSHPRLAPREVIDYEGDEAVKTIQEALNGPGGANWCHHVNWRERRIVDPHGKVPEEVTRVLREAVKPL